MNQLELPQQVRVDDVREARYRRYLSLEQLFPAGRFDPVWLSETMVGAVVDDEGTVAFRTWSLGDDGPIFRIPLADIEDALRTGATNARPPVVGPPFERVEYDGTTLRFSATGAAVRYAAAAARIARSSPPDARRPGRFLRRLPLAPPTPVPDVVSPDGDRYATVVDGNLRIVSLADGVESSLTDDADDGVGWDLESGRRAFGNVAAARIDPWSPDGELLFASRIDRRGLHTVPLIDFLKTDMAVTALPVEAPGMPLAEQAFFLFEARTGRRTAIDLGSTAQALLLPLGWMPDGSGAWFLRYTRDLHRADILAADRDGSVRLVFTETGDSFVRIQHNLLYPGNADFRFLPDSSGFLWLSECSGWNHLYRIAADGAEVIQLTRGAWPVLSIEGTTPHGEAAFVSTHSDADRPYDVHLHRVPLDGTPATRLTTGRGQRTFSLAPDRRAFIETRSAPDEAPISEARNATDGALIATLHRTDPSALKTIGWRPPEEVVVKALDGVTDLWGVMYLPADFDASHRYPVIEHIYAGPQIAYADRSFSLGHTYKPWNVPQALCQLGYAVIVLDAPGTPGRSKAFHDQVVDAMGRRQVLEHAAALRAIAATRPYLRIDRTGIFGHSWGAYFALRALVDAPDLYVAAVASGPAFSPHNVMSEPYLGSDSDSDGYRDYETFGLAADVDGALMIVAGTAEAPMFHAAMRMTHALIDAGVRHELILLPGQPHGYSGASADYFIDASTRFFQRHLGDDRHEPAA